jgi:hypothetical protein
LASLDSRYEFVRSQILFLPELPSLDDVMGRVEGEETRRVLMTSQPSEDTKAKAMAAARQNPRPVARGDQATWCEYCKKEGHRKDEHWCLYPNLRPKGPKKGGFRVGDQQQGENRENREEKRGFFGVEWVGTVELSNPGYKREPSVVLSNDQMRQLFQQLSVMFNANTTKSSGIISNLSRKMTNTNWILDSGVTDHMTRNKKLLSNYKHFEGEQFIIVENGDKMKILGIGSINIFLKIILNILHVRNCASNLLSISKITNKLNYEIIFFLKKYDFSGIDNQKCDW